MSVTAVELVETWWPVGVAGGVGWTLLLGTWGLREWLLHRRERWLENALHAEKGEHWAWNEHEQGVCAFLGQCSVGLAGCPTPAELAALEWEATTEEPPPMPFVCEYGVCPARGPSGICCGASPW